MPNLAEYWPTFSQQFFARQKTESIGGRDQFNEPIKKWQPTLRINDPQSLMKYLTEKLSVSVGSRLIIEGSQNRCELWVSLQLLPELFVE
ncbi:hypothetical protein FIU83_14525 [Halomonas sp. THAF5a]|nr:hypothetical protein FIU83_14525 [Halomonas sp. THAF5a]